MLDVILDHCWALIEEHRVRKRKSINKITPFALGMLTHFGKIYIGHEKSNWFGTIRGQIKNIDKVRFDKSQSASNMYSHIYTYSMQDLDHSWRSTIIAKVLEYKGHKPTREEFIDFDARVKIFVRYISKGIVDRNWNVDEHKTEIDEELRRLFLDKEEV